MEDWFTIEKIDDDTYSISEYGHWEKMHSYLLTGEKNALLIDTGLGIGNIKEEVSLLTGLPVKVVTTHVHWDHIGGHNLFSDISVHKDEASWLINGLPVPLESVKKSVLKEPFTKKAPEAFDINRYTIYKGVPSRVLTDNDIIDLGGRKIKVLHTPGHSPGHICFFEEKRGYLYSGDLIYMGTLFAFYPTTDPEKFKQSVDRICDIKNIKKVLPAHNSLNISTDIIQKVKKAFEAIEKDNLLMHGSGTFNFDGFSIQL